MRFPRGLGGSEWGSWVRRRLSQNTFAGNRSMLKSFMPFYDLLFPLNLGPLTYRGPSGLKPGTLVSAELKKTITRAVVLGPTRNTPADGLPSPSAGVFLVGPSTTALVIVFLSSALTSVPGLSPEGPLYVRGPRFRGKRRS